MKKQLGSMIALTAFLHIVLFFFFLFEKIFPLWMLYLYIPMAYFSFGATQVTQKIVDTQVFFTYSLRQLYIFCIRVIIVGVGIIVIVFFLYKSDWNFASWLIGFLILISGTVILLRSARSLGIVISFGITLIKNEFI